MTATKILTVMLPMAAGVGLVPVGVRAEVVTVRSGNGAVGGPDALITFLEGPPGVPLSGGLFGQADFDAADTGMAAVVVSPHPAWLGTLAKDPNAKWVSVDANRGPASALYAIDFEVSKTNIESATLHFSFAADDALGDVDAALNPTGPNPNGLYLRDANGVFNIIPGTSGVGHGQETNFEGLNITGMISVGENTLYIYNRDIGAAVSGVIFSATINIYDGCRLAGDKDDFASSTDPADVIVKSDMSEAFATWINLPGGNNATFHGGQSLQFDVVRHAIDWDFGYTFKNLPPMICCPASLEIHLKASDFPSTTTSIALQFSDNPPAFAWSYSMNNLDAFFGGDGDWSLDEELTGTLDLCALPLKGGGTLNLLPRINADGFLDVFVQDNTGVDYIELCYNLCNCIDPPPDMVAWWAGDDGFPTDILGNHDGTFIGTPDLPIDFKVGGGALGFFTGTYVVVPTAPALNIRTGDFSIDAWIKTDAFGYRPIVEKGSGLRPGYGLRLQSGRLEFVVCDSNTCGMVVSLVFAELNNDIFHHVAATYSRGDTSDLLVIYIDGAPARSRLFDPLGSISNGDDLLIGAGPSGTPSAPTTFFIGELDEIEIFNRALEPWEILGIAQADSAGKCKCVEPPPDMVAWWPADPGRDECVAAALGGYLIGGATCGPAGKVDYAFSLDGNASFVEIPDDPAQRFAAGVDLSIDAWIRPTSENLDGIHPIVDKRDPLNGTPTGYYLYVSSARLAFQYWDGGSPPPSPGEFITPGPVIEVDTWNHVAVTLDRDPTGDEVKLYVDGNVVSTFNPTARPGPIDSQSPLLIGHNQDDADLQGQEQGPWFFEGMIDEVELFDRALTLQEIRSIFLAGSAGKCRPCRRIRVSQESAPDVGDFDAHVLGCIDVFETSYSPPDYYEWDDPFNEVPYPTSFSNTDFPLTADRSHLFLVAGAGHGLSLVIVHDKPGFFSPGGKAEMAFELGGDPNKAFRTVEDDPSSFVGDPDTYKPPILGTRSNMFASRNEWGTCCTDGQVLTELDGDWVMLVEFTEYVDDPGTAVIDGLDSWFAYSAAGSTIQLALEEHRRVRLDCCKTLPCGDCPTDTDNNGEVRVPDLIKLLSCWGPLTGDPVCACLDIDSSGDIRVPDLIAMLAKWGVCP